MTFTNRNQSNYPTMLLSLLAGAGAGLVVGAMMAPKSGAKLRAQIGDAVDDYLDSAKGKVDDIRNSASRLAKQGLRDVSNAKDEAADRLKNKMSDGVDCGIGTAAKGAHDAIDRAADNVHAGVHMGAKKGHDVVDQAADAVRSRV